MNKEIVALGEKTRFGEAGGPDPSEAARKKNKEQHAASVRRSVRFLAEFEFDVSEGAPNPMKQIRKAIGHRMTGADLAAERRFLGAITGNPKFSQMFTEDVDGKLVERKVEAKVSLADLVNAAAKLDRDGTQ